MVRGSFLIFRKVFFRFVASKAFDISNRRRCILKSSGVIVFFAENFDCKNLLWISQFDKLLVAQALRKIPKFNLISWHENFVETHSFCRVSGKLPQTPQLLCLSLNFPYQNIGGNLEVLRSDGCCLF